MPTPVGAARQCLTEESARALDDAVAVARRRCHSQTTSLHAVSALLAMPSSVLREACSHARSGSCPSRLQFRALDLSVGVSLDRLPTSRSQNDANIEGPPVSNSLMAAIRRSQANQRRHPESFYLYQQSASVLRVELKHFILSILDDPIVSRVFGEAGFRSGDIKLAISHPAFCPGRKMHSRSPVFLCNIPGYDVNSPPVRCALSSGCLTDVYPDENCRRIVSVLRRKGEDGLRCNPLLVGLNSVEVVNKFVSDIGRSDCSSSTSCEGVLGELAGLKVVSLEERDRSNDELKPKIEEICEFLKTCTGLGLLLNYGELKGFAVGDFLDDGLSCLFSELKGLIHNYGQKLWLIGAVANYATLSAFANMFPDVEKSLNLNILPVASPSDHFRHSLASNSSLMRTFVPLGGFFPVKDELRPPISITPPHTHPCFPSLIYDHEGSDQTLFHEGSWRSDSRVIDERSKEVSKFSGTRRKWYDPYQRQDDLSHFSSGTYQVGPTHCIERLGEKGKACWEIRSSDNRPWLDTSCSKSVEDVSYSSEKLGCSRVKVLDSPTACKFSSSGIQKVLETPTSMGDGLATGAIPRSSPSHSVTSSSTVERISHETRERDSLSGLSSRAMELDTCLYKTITAELTRRVHWQESAICAISKAVSGSKARNRVLNGARATSIWFNFDGSDRVGKKLIASTLAEIIYDRRESLISLDLGRQDTDESSELIVGCYESAEYKNFLWGKTIVDQIFAEVRKNPSSVVFLESVDSADILVQNSLSQAVRSGKLSDSHGRQIDISNAIVVTTSNRSRKQHLPVYSEKEILAARKWQMMITVEQAAEDSSLKDQPKVRVSGNLTLHRKRKLHTLGLPEGRACFDLNRTFEDIEDEEAERHSDSASDNTEAWLEEFLSLIDENVTLKPFDFNALAERILKLISAQFVAVFGKMAVLEIRHEAMVQMLAASWDSTDEKAMSGWVEMVVKDGFVESLQRYGHLCGRVKVTLASCKGLPMERQADGVCLPSNLLIDA